MSWLKVIGPFVAGVVEGLREGWSTPRTAAPAIAAPVSFSPAAPSHTPTQSAFVKLVQYAANNLGLKTVPDDSDPRMCFVVVPFEGQVYPLTTYFLDADTIKLAVFSKVPMARCPRGTAEWLRRHSADLPWGRWEEGEAKFFASSSVALDTFADTLENIVTLMVGEVAAFDRALRNKGYA